LREKHGLEKAEKWYENCLDGVNEEVKII